MPSSLPSFSLLNNEKGSGIQQQLQSPLLSEEDRVITTTSSLLGAVSSDVITNQADGRNSSSNSNNTSNSNSAQSEEDDTNDADDADAEEDPTNNTNNSSTELQMFVGRLVLVVVAVLYASLNVSLRFVYSVPDPPTPAALSVTRGWMTVVTFVPLFLCGSFGTNKKKTTTAVVVTATTTTRAITTTSDNNEDEEQENSSSSSGSNSSQRLLDESTTTPTTNNNYATIESLEEERNPFHIENNNDGDHNNNTDTDTNVNTVLPRRRSYSTLLRGVHVAGAELAFYNFSSQALANIGIVTTPSARVSFLTQISVVLVPVLTFCCLGTKRERSTSLSPTVCLGILSSLVGLVLLAHDKTSSDDKDNDNDTTTTIGLGIGDLLILISTLLWSLYIIRLGQIAHRYSNITLQGLKNLYMALFYTLWFLFTTTHSADDDSSPPSSSSSVSVAAAAAAVLGTGWVKNPLCWLTILYSAIGPGSLADMLQQYGQTKVSATESTLLLSMEPVFTSLLGWFILQEGVDGWEKIGGGFLIAGAMLASVSSSSS